MYFNVFFYENHEKEIFATYETNAKSPDVQKAIDKINNNEDEDSLGFELVEEEIRKMGFELEQITIEEFEF